MKTLVIGFGNTLRQDDGFGVYVAEALAQQPLPPEVDIHTCQQLTPELAITLSQYDRAAFIDISAPGELAPGSLIEADLLPQVTSASAVTHHFNPATLLLLAGTLYGHAPQARVFSAAAGEFNLAEGLTPPLQSALPLLTARVLAWIQPS